ncbi:hypothetical protein BDZ90DRAFT_230264 [Jaminaea rosea]|uniref:Uncharacterized protein n=1 Tax=Jaminaea rosea TaxID=1569628 RepID=A0A316UYK2_9BASI|nr:hypothetical protein BDZ90DRAFT_230264 [Jaminaea rosea]PWN29391.1 hypothetical protein BDZ90DRAFT_230264 [Jaminaea rosea]
MPPSKLGPLAGRTLRGSSLSPSPSTPPPGSPSQHGGAGPPSTSSPRRVASGSANLNHNSPNRRASAAKNGGNNDASPSSLSSSSERPYLLSREQETTYHRRLRTLLIEFARTRQLWADEIEEAAELVAKYAGALGELEDEMKERTKRREVAGGVAAGAVREALEDLDATYSELDVAWRRIEGAAQALLKLRDEAAALEREWMTRSEDVRWGPVGGEEMVAATATLSLQAQLQTQQLRTSLSTLFVECSPLGSLVAPAVTDLFTNGAHPDDTTAASSKPRRPRTYNPSASSRLRKEVLTTWRDLSCVEARGMDSFAWVQEVWRSEVGRWDEFAGGSSAATAMPL